MTATRLGAPWLDATTPALHAAIVRRALLDVGLCEMPPGSNRSQRIDEYNTATGAPVGSYWCASAVTAWWRESGADVPSHSAASCDAWLAWAHATARFTATPSPGDVVLYGTPADASHCGVVVRVSPLLLSVEGNTSLGGFDRNGVAVDLKLVNTPRVIGYVSPIPLT